ncbi:unnamed protein product [Symbiodinium natans]|uniref:CS domain-containing protein n=1 Tax=Symbiodinium natans TaxID=878477 RepID=A0A812KZ73_9DINO|nr:unnamed protein product [Symbiodinium natans]
MEIPVFAPAELTSRPAITWGQTEETITLSVPLPPASRPCVSFKPRRVVITTKPSAASACGERTDAPAEEPLLDTELFGEVSTQDWTCKWSNILTRAGCIARQESFWSFGDGVLVVELAKKACEGNMPWWPSAVPNGQQGPSKAGGPALQKLDAKIGEQVVKPVDFEGRSRFRW